jgi:hypothetical protein
MTTDTTAKLTKVEASMRRWHTRLTRASNMLQKLERQRRRLQAPPRTMAQRTAEQKADDFVPGQGVTIDVDEVRRQLDAAIATDIPPFLKRDAADATALTAQRKSKEVDDRKKMPLTGRAALEAIKPKRKRA